MSGMRTNPESSPYRETFPHYYGDLAVALERAETVLHLFDQVTGALYDIGRESHTLLMGTVAAGFNRPDLENARETIRRVVELLRAKKVEVQVERRAD